MFHQEKSLAELEEEDEALDTKLSLTRKKAMIKEAERQLGKGGWRMFSDNNKMSGIDAVSYTHLTLPTILLV